jgi:hypothetical protein
MIAYLGVFSRVFCPLTYFLPLSKEQTAATMHIIAAMTKASLSAVMNGAEMALGKNVDPVRYSVVAVGMALVTVTGNACSIVATGLYPRNEAKSADDAGVALNADAICGTPALTAADDNAAGRVALSDTIIMVKKTAWLTVLAQF